MTTEQAGSGVWREAERDSNRGLRLKTPGVVDRDQTIVDRSVADPIADLGGDSKGMGIDNPQSPNPGTSRAGNNRYLVIKSHSITPSVRRSAVVAEDTRDLSATDLDLERIVGGAIYYPTNTRLSMRSRIGGIVPSDQAVRPRYKHLYKHRIRAL